MTTAFTDRSLDHVDADYYVLEALVTKRVAALTEPVFATNVPGDTLGLAYLRALPETHRQYYNCRCCLGFLSHYGPLVTIDEEGRTHAALWQPGDGPFSGPFGRAVEEMKDLVEKATVTGVFVYPAAPWGRAQTPDAKRNKTWSHFSGIAPNPHKGRVLNASQDAADKLQNFGIVSQGLIDYPIALVREALRVLASDTLPRSEKVHGAAEWFLALHEAIEKTGFDERRRRNVVWRAVATAPPGFCHVRSTMISTLLDDLKAGMDFAAVSKRWTTKMHPLQYLRPQAAPSDGQIDAAEKLVDKLGVRPAFARRFATLADVRVKSWVPRPVNAEHYAEDGTLFGHLKQKPAEAKKLELPTVNMTWSKFAREILPKADEIEVRLPSNGAYYGLLTAVDPEAPAILQWDGLEGCPRNPVSTYVYVGGSMPSRWKLGGKAWGRVTCVFPSMHVWDRPDLFTNHEERVFFVLEGAQDTGPSSLCIFPETLKNELRGIRAVVEAHSKAGKPEGAALGTANGILFGKGYPSLTVRVFSGGAKTEHTIDRWD